MRRTLSQRALLFTSFALAAFYVAAGAWMFALSGRYGLLVISGAVLVLTVLVLHRSREKAER